MGRNGWKAERRDNVGLGPAEPLTKKRKCHDCGVETWDHRCDACRSRFYGGDKSRRIIGEEYGGVSIPGGGRKG